MPLFFLRFARTGATGRHGEEEKQSQTKSKGQLA